MRRAADARPSATRWGRQEVDVMADRSLVEILSFEGCPNRERACALVERVAGELSIDAEIRLVDVTDVDTALRLEFLGSPTVRVEGRDVEPHAEGRRDFALSCRIYQTARGIGGLPDEAWVRAALAEPTR